MSSRLAITPAPRGEGFVELSSSKPGRRVFEKQILHYGDLHYPGVRGGKVKIDDAFADTLIANFTNKVCDIVQVPKAGPNNEHSEDPDRNIGEVIEISKRDKKVYAKFTANDEDAAKKIANRIYLGASAMMHLNYTDTRTNTQVGPTLLHLAITNRPYVTELEDFSEVVAMSASGISDSTSEAVILTATTTEDEMPKTLDETLAELRADHGIDVAELQRKAAAYDGSVQLSNKIQEELVSTGLLKLSNGQEADADLLVGAVAEAGTKIVELTNGLKELREQGEKSAAINEVDKLVLSGHILPKDKDTMVELRLSNQAIFEKLVPEKPVIKLSNENGQEEDPAEVKKTWDEEVARLSNMAGQVSGRGAIRQ